MENITDRIRLFRKLTGLGEGALLTRHEFVNGMNAIMGRLKAGSITPSDGDAVCDAADKLLDIVERQTTRRVDGSW